MIYNKEKIVFDWIQENRDKIKEDAFRCVMNELLKDNPDKFNPKRRGRKKATDDSSKIVDIEIFKDLNDYRAIACLFCRFGLKAKEIARAIYCLTELGVFHDVENMSKYRLYKSVVCNPKSFQAINRELTNLNQDYSKELHQRDLNDMFYFLGDVIDAVMDYAERTLEDVPWRVKDIDKTKFPIDLIRAVMNLDISLFKTPINLIK